jgi:hypothetical protein
MDKLTIKNKVSIVGVFLYFYFCNNQGFIENLIFNTHLNYLTAINKKIQSFLTGAFLPFNPDFFIIVWRTNGHFIF